MCENNKHPNKGVYLSSYTNYLDKQVVYCLDCGIIISTTFVDAKHSPNYDRNS